MMFDTSVKNGNYIGVVTSAGPSYLKTIVIPSSVTSIDLILLWLLLMFYDDNFYNIIIF